MSRKSPRHALLRLLKIGAAGALVAMVLSPAPALASPTARPAPQAASPQGPGVPAKDRTRVLGANWQTSHDVLWTLTSSSDGLGVLRAPVSSAAAWSPVVSLRVQGVDSRQWIGHACVIAGTHTLAVAYGPVEYISVAAMYERGAYAALVDLDTAVTTPLAVRPTFSYFSPSCGSSGTATFTSFGTNESTTSVTDVDAAGRLAPVVDKARGELVDAIHSSDGSVAAVRGSAIVRIAHGRTTTLATERSAVYDLRSDRSGRLTFLVDGATSTQVHRLDARQDRTLATGTRGGVSLDSLADGTVVGHGSTLRPTASGGGQLALAAAPVATTPSLDGTVFAQSSGTPDTGPVRTEIVSPSGATAAVTVAPAAADPALAGAAAIRSRSNAAQAATTSSVTTDANSPCAIQRNDVKTEAYQPSPQQVEWAVDQAVTGHLKTSRAAGYRGYGLAAYTAQGLEPLTALTGGGTVPPQIMLGILANESNLWQASSHVSVGGYGNPLTGNIYGRTIDGNGNESMTIDFSQADCGYGISQVTDGMRTGDMSASKQRAIALDYQVNIAAGLDILAGKWNQLASYGIKMNDGNPSAIENWYAAAWAYNSGLQPNADNGNTTGCTPGPSCTDSAGHWGLGWANNPSNPIYPPNRHMFNSSGSDPASPGNWPYQERVIGWAAYPIYEPNGSYSQAWWTTDQDRIDAIPDPRLFCTAANHCTPGRTAGSAGSCNLGNLHCWTHFAVNWHDCGNGVCGYGSPYYPTGSAEPGDPATADPADCTNTLPAAATIVDDVPSSAPAPAAPCHSITTKGSFAFKFTADANGNYPAHIDLHQINGGLNGHYWFTHTTQTNDLTAITGTWTFPAATTGWGRVMVHVPTLGAQSLQAHYSVVDGTTGAAQTRILNQHWGSNHWLSLGVSQFTASEKVTMTSYSVHDDGSDIAWDAVAFVPVTKPRYKIVGLGDSYSAGEGIEPYDTNTDNSADACHRSGKAYANLITLPGSAAPLSQDTTDELDFIPCSGSHTTSLTTAAVNAPQDEDPPDSGWGGPRYEHGEELQLSQGYADSRTDAVTLSIGGNDARFADVLKSCTLTINICSQSGYVMNSDPQPLAQYEPHIITDLMPAKLKATYLAIHAAAANAQIYVVGYPHIFPAGGASSCGTNLIGVTDQVWINKMTDLMATTTKNVIAGLKAQGVPIYYVDTRPAFTGHDACASDSYINAIVAWSDSGSGRDVPGTGSYHPKANGQAEFATLVSQAMAAHLPAR